MTLSTLATNFAKLHTELHTYALKTIYKGGHNVSAHALLSETYLYVANSADKIATPADLTAWSKTFIKNSLRWPTSAFNKAERLVSSEDTSAYAVTTQDGLDYAAVVLLIEGYIDTLSAYEKRLFSMYYTLELTKAVEISAHLGIGISTAYGVVKECVAVVDKFYIYATHHA